MPLGPPCGDSNSAEVRVRQVGAVQCELRGKTASFRDRKAVSGNVTCSVIVKPSPAADFKVPSPEFPIQLLVVPFNDSASSGYTH